MEHDLTHWYGNTTEKILSWRDLRKKSAEAGKEASIKLINNWWTYAPWVRKTIDPFKPDTWPTPWDMINKGEITQAVMSSYTDLKFERYGMIKLEQHWEIK